MSLGDVLLPFALLLGVLVFIHELGHFLVAKYFGVKVERFSIGFGPALLRRTVGETEYVLAALPLGGYVKMLGELPGDDLPDAERERAFNHRPPWQRIAISLAGPVMNLVLPVFVIAGMLMAGLPTLTTLVQGVVPDSPAARAGLQNGDRIVAVNGEALWRWDDLTTALRESPEPRVALSIERGDAELTLEVERERRADGSLGPIGVEPSAPAPVVGVPDADSPAALSGLATGDRVVAVNDAPVADLYALREVLRAQTGPVELEVRRALDGETETLRVPLRATAPYRFDELGLVPVDFSVRAVESASPARIAGLKEGDLFLRVDGAPVRSFAQVVDAIRGSEGEPVELVLLREGREVTTVLAAQERLIEGPDGSMEPHWAIGIRGGSERVGGEFVEERVRNPLVALGRGVIRTGEILQLILVGIAQLFSGSVGLNSLAGPIGIGEIAADSFQASWSRFFSFMAVISVNLAILNLLPIPVLDGGQIVLTLAESAKGSPLPERAREMAQAVGLSLILVLMGFAFWNDISRNWGRFISFLEGLV